MGLHTHGTFPGCGLHPGRPCPQVGLHCPQVGTGGGKEGTHRGTTSWLATSWRRSGSDDMSDSEEELTPVKAFLFDLNVFLFDTQY